MNRFILLLLSVSVIFGSCDTDIDLPFQGKDKIHFKHYNMSASGDNRVYFNKIVVPSGLREDAILIDTARVIVELLGANADYDRNYKVKICADSTDAIEGVHYEALKDEYVMKANQFTDTLLIYVIRENLSTSFRKPKNKILCLEIEPTESFDIGLARGLRTSLQLSNYLPEPIWWKAQFMGTLDYYHPEKWKILISFDEKFASFETVPYDANSPGGRQYANDLSYFLDTNIVLDSETGERLKMKEILPAV